MQNNHCLTDLLKVTTKVSEKEPTSGLVYQCVKCGAKVSSEELDLRGGVVKCTYCGYRALKKIRPPIVKRIKTSF
jgi:DNA-directed RNA polymerase subunit RPC12/RpoP